MPEIAFHYPSEGQFSKKDENSLVEDEAGEIQEERKQRVREH